MRSSSILSEKANALARSLLELTELLIEDLAWGLASLLTLWESISLRSKIKHIYGIVGVS